MRKELTLFIKNDPTTLRIFPELAAEIGLNESILLLQIDFIIKTSDNYRDGRYWTYQSIHELKKKYFNFWSPSTINRTVNSLEEQKLIHIAKFNKKKYDKTRWFSLNEEGLAKLKNINIKINTHEPGSNQNEPGSNQNEPPIPETTTETTTETSTNTVKEKIVKENLVGKESVPEKEGMKDSVLTTPNSYTVSVSVDEIFLNESIEKNKEKDFRCRALYETLLNRAASAEFPPMDNIGDVVKFKDKLFRYRRKYDTGEISCALELYAALPIDSLHRRNITDYIKHEYQKWDFSQTRNENTVKGQFILEYILWHPVYAHFKAINETGLLQADIENYSKRNTPPANQAQELTELEQDFINHKS